MNMLRPNQIAIAIIGVLVIGGGAAVFLFNNEEEVVPENQTQQVPEVASVVGTVGSLDLTNNSFTIIQANTEDEFTVQIGRETSIVQIIFPAVFSADFAPEKRQVEITDLQVGNRVFIDSSHSLGSERVIVNPKEIQIFPEQ